LRTRLSLLALEDRLTPAVFNIPNGDIAALIAAANTVKSNNEPDTINLAPNGLYTFTAPYTTSAADSGNRCALPAISTYSFPGDSVTINGNGATLQRSTAPGTPLFRLLVIGAPLTATINDLTVTNGMVGPDEYG